MTSFSECGLFEGKKLRGLIFEDRDSISMEINLFLNCRYVQKVMHSERVKFNLGGTSFDFIFNPLLDFSLQNSGFFKKNEKLFLPQNFDFHCKKWILGEILRFFCILNDFTANSKCRQIRNANSKCLAFKVYNFL